MRLARFALRLHPCTPRTRGVSRRQGRMIVGGDFIALSALFLLLIPPARKSAGHIRNRRSAVAQRGSRGLLYSRAKFREDDAMGPRPLRRAVLTVFGPRHRLRKARDRPLPPAERVRYRLPGKGRRARDRRRSRRMNGMSSAANTAAKILRPRLW